MPEALLDRDAELGALARGLRAARAGDGRVILVEGPAGIGKTSLLAAFARTAETDGVAVLAARGGPSSRTPPGASPAGCSSRCAATPPGAS